jgi:hypothetical protein
MAGRCAAVNGLEDQLYKHPVIHTNNAISAGYTIEALACTMTMITFALIVAFSAVQHVHGAAELNQSASGTSTPATTLINVVRRVAQ